jgi:hypothetical protein
MAPRVKLLTAGGLADADVTRNQNLLKSKNGCNNSALMRW